MDKLDLLAQKLAERMDAKEAAKAVETEKDSKIKALEDKVAKLEATPIVKEGLRGSGIEVGSPDVYKGINFKIQGKDAPAYLPKNEKDRDLVVKFMIDTFSKASKNPMIQKAAMQEATAGEGLEYVPEQWWGTILEKATELSVALAGCSRYPIVGSTMHIPTEGNGVTLTYAAEESASTESNPTSADVDLTAKRYGLWGTISQELLDDSMTDMVSFINRLCVKALYTKIDDLVFNGDAYAFTAALGCGSVDETIASIADIASQDYFNVAYKLSKAKRNGAKFYMSPELLARSINLKHGDTYDKLIVNGKIAGVWDIEEVDAIAGVDSTATDVALFGSLQNYALGIRTLSDSIQLNPWGSDQFKQHQVLFGFFVRLAGAPVFTDHFVNMVTA